MNWCNADVHFSNMTLNTPLLTYGLYGMPTNQYPSPQLANIKYFYSDGSDTLIKLPWAYTVTVDRTNWIAQINTTGF
jgi:hypothetical protein